MNGVVDAMFNDSEILVRSIAWTIGFIFICLLVWWFYKVYSLVEGFLRYGKEITSGEYVSGKAFVPFYRAVEIKGTYKGRQVQLGVIFSGLRSEFLPLPHISMKLKEAIGYNTNRLPNYAEISKGFLNYKVKLSILWGVFDRNYPPVFSKSYLVIALEKLLATAEDVERGRTIGEIFK